VDVCRSFSRCLLLALYSALINSIDLWNAPLCCDKDLSMLILLLTISGFDINIPPLLMTVSTVIQQKQTMVDTVISSRR
jgi:hypothetical protein